MDTGPDITAFLVEESSGRALQRIAEDRDDILEMLLLCDQRRREGDDVAGHADQQALLEAIDEDVIGARARRAVARGQFDAGDEADRADVDDVRQTLQQCIAACQSSSSSAARVSRPSSR
jgi:flagellar biosynthesis/type III secretory pathway chaperone